MRALIFIFLLIWLFINASAQTPYLLSDSWPGPQGTVDWSRDKHILFDNKFFYFANDSIHGYELWSTDGTVAGTNMVKDINPGASSSYPSFYGVVNNHLLFIAQTDNEGQELWSTNGTDAGTFMVKDINPGTANGAIFLQNNFLINNDILYFAAIDSLGRNGWLSDGTPSGTRRIVIDPGLSVGNSTPEEFKLISGEVIFKTDNGTNSSIYSIEIISGNPVVNDITPLGLIKINEGAILNGRQLGNAIYFPATYQNNTNNEIFKTDGITCSFVKDLNPGIHSSSTNFTTTSGIEYMGLFYFKGLIDSIGNTFFALNPLNDSIEMKRFMDPNGYSRGTPVIINNKIFYWGFDNIHSDEPWVSDGTAAGTFMLLDINPQVGYSGYPANPEYHIINNAIVFRAYDQTHQQEWWRSDGTIAGTYMLPECNPNGNAFGLVHSAFEANNIRFYGDNEATGVDEMFYTDGTFAGSGKIDLNPGISSGNGSNPMYINTDGSKYFLAVETQQNGIELWSTDGTTTGFSLYADMTAGSASTVFDYFTFTCNGDVFFAADTGSGPGY
jgi:ELWxxDGT repeat protein